MAKVNQVIIGKGTSTYYVQTRTTEDEKNFYKNEGKEPMTESEAKELANTLANKYKVEIKAIPPMELS